jgi:hypothetical protein
MKDWKWYISNQDPAKKNVEDCQEIKIYAYLCWSTVMITSNKKRREGKGAYSFLFMK